MDRLLHKRVNPAQARRPAVATSALERPPLPPLLPEPDDTIPPWCELRNAIWNGSVDLCRELLSRHSSRELRLDLCERRTNIFGQTYYDNVLDNAVQSLHGERVLPVLLACPAIDVNMRHPEDTSIIGHCVTRPDLADLILATRPDVDINSPGALSAPPLFQAIYHGSAEFVRVLSARAGARLDLETRYKVGAPLPLNAVEYARYVMVTKKERLYDHRTPPRHCGRHKEVLALVEQLSGVVPNSEFLDGDLK
jgi:hypothetical protein